MEEERTDALREQDAELRAERVRLARERDEAAKAMAASAKLASELRASLARVRELSAAKQLASKEALIAEQTARIKELSRRRTKNQRRLGDASLDRTRWEKERKKVDACQQALGSYTEEQLKLEELKRERDEAAAERDAAHAHSSPPCNRSLRVSDRRMVTRAMMLMSRHDLYHVNSIV